MPVFIVRHIRVYMYVRICCAEDVMLNLALCAAPVSIFSTFGSIYLMETIC